MSFYPLQIVYLESNVRNKQYLIYFATLSPLLAPGNAKESLPCLSPNLTLSLLQATDVTHNQIKKRWHDATGANQSNSFKTTFYSSQLRLSRPHTGLRDKAIPLLYHHLKAITRVESPPRDPSRHSKRTHKISRRTPWLSRGLTRHAVPHVWRTRRQTTKHRSRWTPASHSPAP